jgi:uncharacterized protein (DUF302 family)
MKPFLFPLLIGLVVSVTQAASPTKPPAKEKPQPMFEVAQTVVKMPLGPGVSMDDAVQAMKIRANALNIKLVAELPLSKQLVAMGEKTGRMEIYQFCDPLTAKKMVEHDIHFAAYLPCRIALVEDAKGRAWLLMMNLDMFIQGANLGPELKAEAIKIRDVLTSIMQAGAANEW